MPSLIRRAASAASVLKAYIWNWLPGGSCVDSQSAMSSVWRHFGAVRRAASVWLRSLMMLTRSSSIMLAERSISTSTRLPFRLMPVM